MLSVGRSYPVLPTSTPTTAPSQWLNESGVPKFNPLTFYEVNTPDFPRPKPPYIYPASMYQTKVRLHLTPHPCWFFRPFPFFPFSCFTFFLKEFFPEEYFLNKSQTPEFLFQALLAFKRDRISSTNGCWLLRHMWQCLSIETHDLKIWDKVMTRSNSYTWTYFCIQQLWN